MSNADKSTQKVIEKISEISVNLGELSEWLYEHNHGNCGTLVYESKEILRVAMDILAHRVSRVEKKND